MLFLDIVGLGLLALNVYNNYRSADTNTLILKEMKILNNEVKNVSEKQLIADSKHHCDTRC